MLTDHPSPSPTVVVPPNNKKENEREFIIFQIKGKQPINDKTRITC